MLSDDSGPIRRRTRTTCKDRLITTTQSSAPYVVRLGESILVHSKGFFSSDAAANAQMARSFTYKKKISKSQLKSQLGVELR